MQHGHEYIYIYMQHEHGHERVFDHQTAGVVTGMTKSLYHRHSGVQGTVMCISCDDGCHTSDTISARTAQRCPDYNKYMYILLQ